MDFEFRGGIERLGGKKFASIGRANPAGNSGRFVYLRGLRSAVQRRQKIAPDAFSALRQFKSILPARKNNASCRRAGIDSHGKLGSR